MLAYPTKNQHMSHCPRSSCNLAPPQPFTQAFKPRNAARCSNGRSGEAALQRSRLSRRSAMGRTRIVTLPYLAPSIGLICITNAPAHSPSLRLSSSDNGCSTASTVLVLTHSWNFGCSKRSSNCSVQPRRMKYTYRTGPMVSVE